jgi:hypothetical protein
MNFQPSLPLVLLFGIAAFVLGVAVAVWSRRPTIQRLEGEGRALQAQLDNTAHALTAAAGEKAALVEELADVRRELASVASRNEQLRDIVKVHVARRREAEEWAGPIKATLGDGVGQALRVLKDQVARQESVLQRQERLVAETQDQYRAKRDEMERMRRELSIKNYHIAALNARFIRMEERIGGLIQLVGLPAQAESAGDADTLPPSTEAGAQPTDRHVPLDVAGELPSGWTQRLDDWHKQLDGRFAQLDRVEHALRGQRFDDGAGPRPAEDRPGGDATAGSQ